MTTSVAIRPMQPADQAVVTALLDEAIGAGFWNPAKDLDDIVLVAEQGGEVVGVASASVESQGAAEPLGHISLVAVRPDARRRGIARRLLEDITAACEASGAKQLVAYAWVHHDVGLAPLSGALVQAGFTLKQRIEGFYAQADAPECPACRKSPCVCAAEEYRRAT